MDDAAESSRLSDEWPLPPPWMFDCGDCVGLYRAMKEAPGIVGAARESAGPGIDCDPFDSIVSTQIRLARHIADRHGTCLPAPEAACPRCASDAAPGTRMPEVLALEHRARHLIVPPSIAANL